MKKTSAFFVHLYFFPYFWRYFKLLDKMKIKSYLIALLGLIFVACENDDEPAVNIPWYEDTETLRADFAHALADVQTPEESDISTTLMPIIESNNELEWKIVDGKKMVLVCAMMTQDDLKYWAATDLFLLTKQTGLWVTIPAEWSHRAKEFEGLDSVASRYRMIQMLGLTPDCKYDTVVEFYVDPSGVFRPAADPTISTTTCGFEFPSWADADYTIGETNFREWFAYQKSIAYLGDYACPWTQLGYTYDWHHGADKQGLSEYIASVQTQAFIKVRQGCWTFIQEHNH